MKNSNFIVLSLLILTAVTTTSYSAEQVYTEWSLRSRGDNSKLIELSDKSCVFDQSSSSGEATIWVIESTESNRVYIKNKSTGNYLSIDLATRKLLTTNEKKSSSSRWYYGVFDFATQNNCGWYTLQNDAMPADYMIINDKGNAYMGKTNRNTDYCAHILFSCDNSSLLPFEIFPDSVRDATFLGIRSAVALSPKQIKSNYHQNGNTWTLSKNISEFPRFEAQNNTLLVALYNMALEEMLLNIRTDSTFMTGALWPDTWTRDAVYSIYFSYAWIMPDISVHTLRKQVLQTPKEALQDTGSGGSWPISTDRVVWALAAWEYYLTTGDLEWLKEAYEGLSYTAEKDLHVAFDPRIGLFKGETCSMDWRTHTYPNWFTNANIGESFSCGTNALHAFLYHFLSQSATLLGKDKKEIKYWNDIYNTLCNAINRNFWDKEKGVYTCYLYPDYLDYRSTSRIGVMSNGLCTIAGVSSPRQTKEIVERFPLYPYGAAVLYPSIADDFSYHNKSVWPVWQTPYLYAAKKVNNDAAVEHILSSLIRQSALFLSHKENMAYDTGYDLNTALNSPRQLWSVSSYLSAIYRIIFGLEKTSKGLTISPMPTNLVQGDISLTGFRYRKATVDIFVTGKGNKVKLVKVNGKEVPLNYCLSPNSIGNYRVEITMEDINQKSEINLVKAGPDFDWSPNEPLVQRSQEGVKTPQPISDVEFFVCHGKKTQAVNSSVDLETLPSGIYNVLGRDVARSFDSDLSEPLFCNLLEIKAEAEDGNFNGVIKNTALGFSGKGYVEDFIKNPMALSIAVDLPQDGDYLLSFVGANGNGPHGTQCAIRSLIVDGQSQGTILFETTEDWSKWMESNRIIIRNIKQGKHIIQLLLNPENKGYDNNMSTGRENINDCLVDYAILRLLPSK